MIREGELEAVFESNEGILARMRSRKVTRVISFTSGKGGVGKTTSVINIALGLGALGARVLILDADLGLANVDILLGLKPKFTLEHVFKGIKRLDDIILDGPDGVSIIPAASGVSAVSNLDAERRTILMSAIEQVASRYDYLLIDTSAGIDSDVMYFNSASSEIVVVVNPEPASLTDSYALMKLLANDYGEQTFSILVNDVQSEGEARRTFMQLSATVERFLNVRLKYQGYVPTDKSVSQAVREQRGVVEIYPSSSAALSFKSVAQGIHESSEAPKIKGGMQLFFKQLLELNVGN